MSGDGDATWVSQIQPLGSLIATPGLGVGMVPRFRQLQLVI